MSAPALTSYSNGVSQVSGDNLNTFSQWSITYAQLKSFSPNPAVPNLLVYLQGYAAPGDGGQGFFYWNTVTGTDDGGLTTIVPNGSTAGCWFRIPNIGSSTAPSGTNFGLTSFILTPTSAPAVPASGLTVNLPYGTAVVGPSGPASFIPQYVILPAITYTAPVNTITDIWLNSDGTTTTNVQPSNDYPFLPHYNNSLHVWQIASNATNILSIRQPGNTYATVNRPNDIAGTIDTFVELFYLLNTTTNWSSSLTVTYQELLVTSAGNVYQVVSTGGITGSIAPTSISNVPFLDGTASVVYYAQASYLGMFRYSQNSGIEYYFANLGLQQTCHKTLLTGNPFGLPAGTQMTTLVKNHILGVFFHLVTPHQTSATYLQGMKMFAAGYAWLCTTAGTSAASSPFSGSYTPGTSVVTDGTAVFLCFFVNYASQQYFWYDVKPDFLTYTGPDSQDNYASTFFNLIARYVELTNDTAWLLTSSPQPFFNSFYTYKQLLDSIMYFNLSTQLANFLCYGFQSGINPADGTTYNVQQLEDNCGDYSGYIDQANIYTAVGDNSGATTALTNAAYIGNGIASLYNNTYNLFITYYGQDITTWVNNPDVAWYPYLQAQFFPEYYNVQNIDDDQRKLVRFNVSNIWPNYFNDRNLDSYPDNFLGFMAAKLWQDTDKAYDFVEKTERYFLAGGVSSQSNFVQTGPTDIAEWGYYLMMKDILMPTLTPLKIANGRLSLEDQTQTVITAYVNNALILNGQTAAFTLTLPANCYITDIMIQETAGNAVTGGIDIGTAASGAQIVSAFAVAGSSLAMIPAASILKRVFSTSAAQIIYIGAHTSFNSASLNVEIRYNAL